MELASDGGQIMPTPLIDPIFDGLARALDVHNRRHDVLATNLIEDASAPARADGNTVDLDLQMAKLAENAGRYTALTRILGKRIGLVRLAIDGGR
jgi:flagellar basal body rod protein FlgB